MTASRAGPPARPLPGWLLVVAALLLLLASAVGIEVLDARLAASLHAAHTLTQVRAQTNLLSAINWETVAQHARPAGDGAEERAATGQLTAALAALVPLEQDIPAMGVCARSLGPTRAMSITSRTSTWRAGSARRRPGTRRVRTPTTIRSATPWTEPTPPCGDR